MASRGNLQYETLTVPTGNVDCGYRWMHSPNPTALHQVVPHSLVYCVLQIDSKTQEAQFNRLTELYNLRGQQHFRKDADDDSGEEGILIQKRTNIDIIHEASESACTAVHPFQNSD